MARAMAPAFSRLAMPSAWVCCGRLEIAARPVRERQQQSCTAAPDMVVRRQEVQCPARLLHGAGHIAERLGAEGTGEGDRPRQRPELLRVRNHHPAGHDDPRSLASTSSHRSASLSSASAACSLPIPNNAKA